MEFKDKIDGECAHSNHDKLVCLPSQIVTQLSKSLNVASQNLQEAMNKIKQKTNCDTQVCVVEKMNTVLPNADEILQTYFKPKGPKTGTAWLSNTEIDSVLEQLQDKYKDFLHIYFHMRDFQTRPLPTENNIQLHSLEFPEYYLNHNKRTFGVVFNTDKSTGKGIHWLAVFGDFRDPEQFTIEYFDSAGKEPMPEVLDWMATASVRWGKELKKMIKPVQVSCIVYQNDNHSCGVYALYYIMSRLHGVEKEHFQSPDVNDAIMHQFRRFLFRE